MRKTKQLILVGFLIFLTAWPSLATTQIKISGRILDATSGRPLEGANIYLSDAACGTVSNADGHFTFYCRAEKTDTLVISYLGYIPHRSLVNNLKPNTTIYLQPKSLDLGDEIVISAERMDLLKQDIPHAKTTLEFKEIERYGSSEISDILKPITAIRIEGNDLDGRRVQIRGSDADEVNVYMDGILINSVRFDNSADLSIIPVESIQNLEVLKGGNSAFLGNGAFGGVINITTKKETHAGLYLKGKLGSFETRYLVGNLDLPVSKKLVFNYFGQFNDLNPTIEYFPDERYRKKTENNTIRTAKQNHSLSMNYYARQGQLNARFLGYFLDYTKSFFRSTYRKYLSAASYRGMLLGISDIDFTVSHLHSRDKVRRNPAGSANFLSSYISNRFNARLAKKIIYKGGEVQLMSEYYHDDLQSSFRVKDLDWENELNHSFLYDNRASVAGVVSFNDKLKKLPLLSWKTFLGIRGDLLANGNKDVTNMAGLQLNYTMEKIQLKPYFNYGKNVKYPTLQENAYIRDLTNISGTDTTQTLLEPEYSNSSELGVTVDFSPGSRFFRSMEFTLALFSRTIYNKLLTRPFDDVIANVQIGRNQTRGIETSFKTIELMRHFTFLLSFIQLDISDPLLYAYKPKKNFSLNMNYATRMGFYLTSTFFFEGKSLAWYYDKENVFRTEQIPEFFDLDMTAGYRYSLGGESELEIQLSGYNILDNSGFRYYYLKKEYWQVSLALRL